MNRIHPSIRILAERLIAHETGNRKLSLKSAPAFEVIAKLQPRLENLMGRAGFHALLSRARVLAMRESPGLAALCIHEDASLEESAESRKGVFPSSVLEGRCALLAHLLSLLEAFIGETLMLRLVQEAWPKLPPHPAG